MNETARAAPAAVGSTREWALIAGPWISRTARLMKLQEIARSNHAPLPKAHILLSAHRRCESSSRSRQITTSNTAVAAQRNRRKS